MNRASGALRSFAGLLLRMAERLDRPAARPPAPEPAFPASPVEERILELRHRLLSRYY